MKPTQKNRKWIWLYVVLALLACVAITINLTYNLQQQLTVNELQAARALWDKQGPKNYDLVIRKDVGVDKSVRETIKAKVRNRAVVDITLNDQPLERRLWAEYDMPGVFDWIERFLEIDAQPKAPRAFRRARFDPNDGHVVHFVRSVRGAGQRQELTIELSNLP